MFLSPCSAYLSGGFHIKSPHKVWTSNTRALNVPSLHGLHGRSGEQFVRQKVDLLHDVGESDWKLLSQEDERRLLTGIDGTLNPQ